MEEYNETVVGQYRSLLASVDNAQLGDIVKGCKVCVDVLTKADGKPIPLRLVLGSDAFGMIKDKCNGTINLLDEWKDVICSTDHAEK